MRVLPPDKVAVGGEIGRCIDLALHGNIMALDVDRDFLDPFRKRRPAAEMKAGERFTGLGLLIDAAVAFSRHSGGSAVISLKEHLVDETIKTQSGDGYIGAFVEEPDGGQLWQDWCWHDAAYVALGLSEDFLWFDTKPALAAARKLVDFLIARWRERPDDVYFTTVGTVEACFSLFRATGEEKYLQFAADEPLGKRYEIVPAPLWTWTQSLHPPRTLCDEELAAEPHVLPGTADSCHMYRVFERCTMQLRLHSHAPRKGLPEMSARLLDAMTRPRAAGMLVTGATGLDGRWHENQDGTGPVAENCATVYELWFLAETILCGGNLEAGDIMERVIFNTLLASQDAAGRQIRHFTPFSGPREFFAEDACCCPGNFRRGMGHLPSLIYLALDTSVAVNLYTCSEAEFELPSGVAVRVEQDTDYPNSGQVELVVDPSEPSVFAVQLRVPRWSSGIRVAVNGQVVDDPAEVPGGIEIEREWQPGDGITLVMPMLWRWVAGRDTQKGRAALSRGPMIYCLSPSRNGLAADTPLRDITLDVESLCEPEQDEAFRPDGTCVKIKGWSPGHDTTAETDLSLVLTEFADPGGEEAYFRLSDGSVAEEDELCAT